MQKEKDAIKIMSLITMVLCAIFVLTGCAKPGHQKGDTYKIMLGTKCAPGGTIQSPIWFHTTIGPKQVSEENCEKNK